MIPWDQFLDIVRDPEGINRPIDNDPDGQMRSVESPQSDSIFVVAGPGSGKTTVLALRALKFIYVDGVAPEEILATTFTRKAARELRSRILSWGDRIRRTLLERGLYDPDVLESLDLNAVITGTLDSIIEKHLALERQPGAQPPVMVETFVAEALMLRNGLLGIAWSNGQWDADFEDYIVRLRTSRWGLNAATYTRIARQVRDKVMYDLVDFPAFGSQIRQDCPVCDIHPHAGIGILQLAVDSYVDELHERGLQDFAGLEAHFLERLRDDRLPLMQGRLQVMLVDEYQDTNLLQEQIYFTLAARLIEKGGGITIVGDDDQSLFRFRGATVDLFRLFPDRAREQLGIAVDTVYLSRNYRSTDNIVNFCNNFSRLDADFQPARVPKPRLTRARHVTHNPAVLGLFRDDITTLSSDLSTLVRDLFREGQLQLPDGTIIRPNPVGSIGDCAVLMHSPSEVREYWSNGEIRRRERLPFLLRQELGNLDPPILLFNPRGRMLAEVQEVSWLCGLVLESIDPNGDHQNSLGRLPLEAQQRMNQWRDDAVRFMQRPPSTGGRNSLQEFVRAWASRESQTRSEWPESIYIADLIYKLVAWIPQMQDDVEGLVYLEVILRTVSESTQFSPFGSRLVFGELESPSVRAAIRDILVPIALGTVDVDEDLLETLPRDRLNVLSIHQAKGLEFPLTIVDIGSDFQGNYPAQRRFRFPENGDVTHRLEDDLRQFSDQLGVPGRNELDRAFDDLIRLYYVAYSRAQDVLLLTGLNSTRTNTRIRNIAAGWDRSGTWHWRQGLENITHI